MSGAGSKAARKSQYFEKLKSLLLEYPKMLIVTADNVGSNQMQRIRHALRGKAVILMGKNTMIRKCVRQMLEDSPVFETLLPLVKGNIGFVFTKDDLNFVKNKLLEHKVGAPAKAGTVAPNDVIVPKGNTGLEPTQTSFLQALNIPSKINRGQVEIVNDVFLIKKGDKVGSSEATLLQKLNIKPFAYGLIIKHVLDNGFVYDPAILELTDEDILAKFRAGVNNVAQLSLQIGYPSLAALPHAIGNAYKNILALAVETAYSFPAAQKIKDFIANPTAFAAASAPAASKAAAPAKEEKKAAPKEEKVEEEEEDMFGGGGLFGDD
jgi:large subunit ribosomal protein LP0